MKLHPRYAAIATLSLLLSPLQQGAARGNNDLAGLTFLESSSARAAALGEALSAARNDVSAQIYNPALLTTLTVPQASLLYKKGLVDDAFGQVLLGVGNNRAGMGLSLGFYSGGEVDLFNGSENRTVTAQKDFSAGLRYAQKLGRHSFGVAGKYLSSELAESQKASAVAGDIGLQRSFGKRLRAGAALQNIGTNLKYIEKTHRLPRIARVGFEAEFSKHTHPTTLLFDIPYDMNERIARPAVGFEVILAPLSLRTGYQSGFETKGFSAGIGFAFQSIELGYAFGLANQFNDSHRVSFTYHFRKSGAQP